MRAGEVVGGPVSGPIRLSAEGEISVGRLVEFLMRRVNR